MAILDNTADKLSIIADGVIINGNLSGSGDLKVSGCIEGEVHLPNGDLLIEGKGYVQGKIEVKELKILSGEARGTIEASHKVIVKNTGRIEGDVKTSVIDISSGAILDGKFEVKRK